MKSLRRHSWIDAGNSFWIAWMQKSHHSSLGTLVAFRKRLIDQQMDRRLIERTIELASQSQTFGSRALRAALDSSPLWGVRLAWEHAVDYRRPAAILIDEAQHMGRAGRGSKLLEHLEHLKCLAITTKTLHVLFGTYQLLKFRDLNAQLSRRSIDIHFPRYQATSPEDGASAGPTSRLP
jgi:hypothetical protein